MIFMGGLCKKNLLGKGSSSNALGVSDPPLLLNVLRSFVKVLKIVKDNFLLPISATVETLLGAECDGYGWQRLVLPHT